MPPHASYKPHRACQISYEIGLILTVIFLVLAWMNAALTRHFPVDGILDSSHFQITTQNPQAFEIGARYPAYRYSNEFRLPLGWVTVTDKSGERVTLEDDPKSLAFPIGVQAKVTAVHDADAVISSRTMPGLTLHQPLTLFEGTHPVGSLSVNNLAGDQVICTVQSNSSDHLVGLIAGQYSLASQVVVPPGIAMSYVTPIALIAGIIIYGLGWLRLKESPLFLLGLYLRKTVHAPANWKLAFHAIFGPIALWFLAGFSISAVHWVCDLASNQILHRPLPDEWSFQNVEELRIPLTLVLSIAYLVLLHKSRRSPLLTAWERLKFRGGIYRHEARQPAEHTMVWLMNLVIVYAFSHTILGGFLGNFSIASSIGWSRFNLSSSFSHGFFSLSGWADALHALGVMATHAPQFKDASEPLLVLRYFIFSACIASGVFYYYFAVVAYAWGKRIRNVDFTVIGWVVNAVCYAPLLGGAFWRILPSSEGVDPIFIPGVFMVCALTLECYLNVVYSFTIINLGTMFGLMTDKGLRTTGYYSVVRHPSYTIEGPLFVTLSSQALSGLDQWMAVVGYFVLYYVRSERDEQFMRQSNPGYEEYAKQVPYKYIPGLI